MGHQVIDLHAVGFQHHAAEHDLQVDALVQGGPEAPFLGHQTLQMTMRYAHLATNDLDMCVPVLERRQ